MNDHELLVKARNIQAANGLAKDVLRDLLGHTCMVGSISQAISGDASCLCNRDQVETFHRISRIIGKAVWNDEEVVIPYQNNRLDTTLDDVLGWFDQAIAATAPSPEDFTDMRHGAVDQYDLVL